MAELTLTAEKGHPCGHQFRISIESCGHYGLVGQGPEAHKDADWWSEPTTLIFRAHNQRDALLLAAAEPLTSWFPEEAEDPDEVADIPVSTGMENRDA